MIGSSQDQVRTRSGQGKDQDLDQELDNYLEDLEQWESDVMVANQIIITVLGSNIVKCLVLETLIFILTCC